MVVDLSVSCLFCTVLEKGAEAFTKTAGERLGGKMVALCQSVVKKFNENNYAEQSLARGKELAKSEERQLALKGILAERIKEDPSFAEEVKKLFDEFKSEISSGHAIFDQRGQDVGTQTNIGNVQGTVNIGQK